jgi:tRNA threonylcarbamoyl adenosine modification protein (Sua5/YciO/YrdC/YwlC family)
MSQFFQIHPENPQHRLIQQAAGIVRKGGVIAYPTDSAYALGCRLGDKDALEQIRRIRQLDAKHNFTLMCKDLSEIATYAKVSNQAYRSLKAHSPGPYTFILTATNEVPRRILHRKRRTVGIRVPDNAIALALLQELDEPLLSVTLRMPGDEYPLMDPREIRDTLQSQVELVIDGGFCGIEATTVVDLLEDVPRVVREGRGSIDDFVA